MDITEGGQKVVPNVNLSQSDTIGIDDDTVIDQYSLISTSFLVSTYEILLDNRM